MLCLDIETQEMHLCPLRTATFPSAGPTDPANAATLAVEIGEPPVQYARLRPCTALAWNVIWRRTSFMQKTHIA